MSSTPATQSSPSRSHTPSPAPRDRASTLRPAYSSTSLHSFSYGHTHVAPGTPSFLATTTVSALPPHLSLQSQSIDPNESSTSLVPETTDNGAGSMIVTGDVDQVDVEGVVRPIEGDAKVALRDQLKRTLSRKGDSTENIQPSRNDRLPVINELRHQPTDAFPIRKYFVLTNAGKPVFTSPRLVGNEENDDMTSAMGLMQAIISVFADDGDKIRCINAGRTRITFLLRSPLYYVSVSSWREPESIIRVHLEYLHQQILSVVTGSQLHKIFEKRTNFDLRRLLDGTEMFLHSLIVRLEDDLGLTMGSLGALRIDQHTRAKAGDLLVPPKDLKNILYALLLSRSASKVFTLSRPKKQSIHPSDLHILLNTLSSPSLSSNSSRASASWLPICLPKYNADGFLYVFVCFFSLEEEGEGKDGDVDGEGEGNEVALVIVTPRRDDFERVRGWAGTIEQTLTQTPLLKSLVHAARTHPYNASSLAIPGLVHFVYKSRVHVQITMPCWEEPYDEIGERRRLMTLYQTVHDAIHARSGQEQGPLKLQYLRTEQEIIMGWLTQPFELYVTLSPRLPKSAVVGAANAVVKWVKKEESRLFIRDAPVF